MFLNNTYYHIQSQNLQGGKGLFSITIDPTCDIFLGHFPGNPICPGVCGIEIIRECATLLVGKPLRIASVKSCRFTEVLYPQEERTLTLELSIEPIGSDSSRVKVNAGIAEQDKVCITFRGEMEQK